MSESLILLNNELVALSKATVSVLDRGFLFGDGVYEVLPVFAGKVIASDHHWKRLNSSLDAALMTNPFASLGHFNECFDKLLRNNCFEQGDGSIYCQVTRGPEAERDHCWTEPSGDPTWMMMLKVNATKTVGKGIHAITMEDFRWQRADIKSTSLLGNVLIKQQAKQKGAQEAILLRDGWVTEGAASNVFIVEGEKIKTPPESHHLLSGITRARLLSIMRQAGWSVTEEPIEASALHHAEEIWVTSSTRWVVPVIMLDDKPVGSGADNQKWRSALALYRAEIERLSKTIR